MSPRYKLTYFPARLRPEVARQLFYLADVPFEDHRVPSSEWQAFKPKAPFGSMPILEVDGEELPQSYAINRYLAGKFGYVGETPFEEAWVDAIADQHKDFFNEITPWIFIYFGIRKGDKEQLLKDVAIPARDKYFSLLEKILKDNGNNGHFVGSSITWVDLLIADNVSIILQHVPGFLDGFPLVLETVKKIESTPKLKDWIEKRAPTVF